MGDGGQDRAGGGWDTGTPATQLLLCQRALWGPPKEPRRQFRECMGNLGGGEMAGGQKVSPMQWPSQSGEKSQQIFSGLGEREGRLRATMLWRVPQMAGPALVNGWQGE